MFAWFRCEPARASPKSELCHLNIAIVTPVFNDWMALERLVTEIDGISQEGSLSISVFIVNDGSTIEAPAVLKPDRTEGAIRFLAVLHLVCNVGHQRAIALGLAEVASHNKFDAVVVMDADGEDRPDDIPKLIALHRETPNAIIVARRTKRSEGLTFSAFYALYKIIFRVLTGKKINFGNFSLIPATVLQKLVHTPESWNHLAAAYVRSPTEIRDIPTTRGTRYSGRSHMNLAALVLHGIGAMAVFSDILFARLLLICAGLASLSIFGIIATAGIRMFSDLAIPGWATTVVGILSVFFVQILLVMMVSAFLLLSGKSSIAVTPASQHAHFIERHQVLQGTDS